MRTQFSNAQRLTRSDDGYLAGVCEGIGRHFGVNPNAVRLIWLVAVLGFGTGLLMYLLMWWLMPRDCDLPVEPAVPPRAGNGLRQPPLLRTSVDRKLLGVCGGIARRWDLEPTLVRLGALSLLTVSAGLVGFAYLVAAVLIPSTGSARRHPHPVEL